jgi:hypothetical protein
MIWKTLTRVAPALALAFATPAFGESLAINFGADEPNAAATAVVNGPAGVYGTAIWNNTTLADGTASNLLADNNGVSLATTASVTWSSTNTWAAAGRGEENITAPPGNDFNLMQGYLDTLDVGQEGVSVTVSGIDSIPFIDGLYDVTVYMKGGVIGRGGDYTIGNQTLQHFDTGPFTGTYVEGEGGDYIVFKNISGDSFNLTSAAVVTRAPVNGIEITPSEAVLGDADGDGIVDIADFDLIRSNFLNPVAPGEDGDLDFSATVDLVDFRIWKTAFGGGGPNSVPEPSAILLLVVGGAGLVVARRLRTRG